MNPALILIPAAFIGICLGAVLANTDGRSAEASTPTTYALCHTGGGHDCVVDGDTIWSGGIKIRVADIDAPETHSPKCPAEAELGRKATLRAQQWINAGPFELASSGRDEDRYGRKLRILVRNGESMGDVLVSEGLARKWDGARRGWC